MPDLHAIKVEYDEAKEEYIKFHNDHTTYDPAVDDMPTLTVTVENLNEFKALHQRFKKANKEYNEQIKDI